MNLGAADIWELNIHVAARPDTWATSAFHPIFNRLKIKIVSAISSGSPFRWFHSQTFLLLYEVSYLDEMLLGLFWLVFPQRRALGKYNSIGF